MPWAIYIDPGNRIAGYQSFDRFHPLFAYESFLNIIGCIMLLVIGRKYKDKLLDGEIFFIYVIYYSTIRFGLEWLRIGNWTMLGFPTACWISVIAVIASIAAIIYRRKRMLRTDKPDASTPPGAGGT